MRRYISPEKRRAIAKDYSTMSAKDVAEKHDVHYTTVYTIVREHGGLVRAKDKRVWQNEWQHKTPASNQERLSNE